MITIYELTRGVNITDPKQLQWIGHIVTLNYSEQSHGERHRILSVEDGNEYEVWGYSEEARTMIERAIKYCLGKWDEHIKAKRERTKPTPPKSKSEARKKRPRIYKPRANG